MKIKYILFGLISIFLMNCETINNDPVFDLTPAIRITQIDKDTMVQFLDSLVVTIEYEDGNGDLGTSDPDVNSIFVKDSRLDKADEYYLPPLAPEGENISIQGTFNLILNHTFLLGNGTEEKVIYDIYLVDRAGNESNLVQTEEIVIVKE